MGRVSENIITRSENKTRNIDIDLLFMYTSTFDVNIGGDLLISSKEDIKNKLKKECPILKRAKQVGEEYKKQEEERLRKIKQSKSV